MICIVISINGSKFAGTIAMIINMARSKCWDKN
jgi:hypothetical protein